MNVARYGEWTSPIAAPDVAAGTHAVTEPRWVGDEVWWLEARPAEGGRYLVRRAGAHGHAVDVLPPPWNARTRVHEYGGGAWTATDDGRLVFAEFGDQRLYVLTPGREPEALTHDPPVPAAWRYADLTVHGGEVWCVRERHAATVTRDIAAIPLDGSAVGDASAIRFVAGGSRFLAQPRLSPDGKRLAWIAWEHPQMPWDGTELRVADLNADGRCSSIRVLLGSTTESVLQPEWADDATLYAISDRSGFWNLYRVPLDSAGPVPLCPYEADFAGPLWQLSAHWYAALDDGRLLTVRTFGTDTLAVLDPQDRTLTDLDLGAHTSVELGAVRDGAALVVTGGALVGRGLRRLDLGSGALSDVRLVDDTLPDEAYRPEARPMTFPGRKGREVHAVVYPPRNPHFAAPDGELPPYVAFVHGGPTAHVEPRLSLLVTYFTSRGIGIVDVNYGGSTGYGRAYRERLRGQWGVVDVEDTIAAVLGLADAGLADRDRLAIEGGSAGGWTVLSALTRSDVFACGVSYFGVAELVHFVEDTHDFESRYLEWLIGPLPEARELYDSRAPLNNVAGLSCPVLLLQGLDDPVVPPSQAEQFRDALVGKGIPHAYRAYDGESHGFRRLETIVDSREAELSFYGQILGFTPPGVPVLHLWRP